MKIYRVTTSHYHFWKTSTESGHIKEDHYFLDKNKADAFLKNEIQHPYWVDFNHQKAEPEKDYQKPTAHLEEIETED